MQYEPHGVPLAAGPGEIVVQLRQTFAGVPLLRAVRSVRFRDRGEPLVTGRPVPVTLEGLPDVTVGAREAAYAASRRVAADAGVQVSNRRPLVTASFAEPDRPTVLRKVGFREPMTARLRLLPATDGNLALVWEVHLELEDEHRPCSALVAATGSAPEIVELASLASHVVSGPVHPVSPPTQDPVEHGFPPERSAFPFLDGLPLPPGPWIAADRTTGNNAVAVGDDGEPFRATPLPGGALRFQPEDPLGLDQARVGAFWLCNYLHDFFWMLGFDEAKGNFQERNHTGAGGGRDAVRVFVFRRRKQPFASFLTRLDGREPELVLRPGPAGHAGLDADVIVHEYTHGVTDRIVGRGHTERPFTAPQSVALAEGLSDWFALTLQNHLRRRAGTPPVWVFGRWVSGNGASGLRRAPYGPDFVATYGALREPGFGSHHDAGQVWCQTLLDVTDALGGGDPDVADERAWQVVFDAVCRLHPGGHHGPHFLHARDAVYAALAARVLTWDTDPVALTLAVRAAFTARGMGDAARSPTAGYDGIVESFQEDA